MFEAGQTKIRDIVFSVMARMGEVTTHKFPDLLVFALDGYWEYQQDYKQEVRTVEKTLSSARRIELPRDFIRLVKIGIKVGDRVEAIIPDNDLALKGPNKYEPNESYTVKRPNVPFRGYLNDYGQPRELWADTWRGANRQGFYTIDKMCNEIIFTPEVDGKKIYLEYISNELKPNSYTYVSQDAYQVISAYIWWQIARYDKRMGDRSSEAQLRKQAYLDEVKLMHRRRSDLSVAGLVFLSRKHTWRGAR